MHRPNHIPRPAPEQARSVSPNSAPPPDPPQKKIKTQSLKSTAAINRPPARPLSAKPDSQSPHDQSNAKQPRATARRFQPTAQQRAPLQPSVRTQAPSPPRKQPPAIPPAASPQSEFSRRQLVEPSPPEAQ